LREFSYLRMREHSRKFGSLHSQWSKIGASLLPSHRYSMLLSSRVKVASAVSLLSLIFKVLRENSLA